MEAGEGGRGFFSWIQQQQGKEELLEESTGWPENIAVPKLLPLPLLSLPVPVQAQPLTTKPSTQVLMPHLGYHKMVADAHPVL